VAAYGENFMAAVTQGEVGDGEPGALGGARCVLTPVGRPGHGGAVLARAGAGGARGAGAFAGRAGVLLPRAGALGGAGGRGRLGGGVASVPARAAVLEELEPPQPARQSAASVSAASVSAASAGTGQSPAPAIFGYRPRRR